MAKYKKEDIIDKIVKMRIEDMASTKTIIETYLKGELGYKTTYSYDLLKQARVKIVEYYTIDNKASLEEAIGQMEVMVEDAKKNKDYKLAFLIRRELSKIMGHYVEKLEVTGDIKTLNTIKLIEIKREDIDKNDTE